MNANIVAAIINMNRSKDQLPISPEDLVKKAMTPARFGEGDAEFFGEILGKDIKAKDGSASNFLFASGATSLHESVR